MTGDLLRVGKRDYATVVLPRFTDNLNARTLDLLEGLLKGGGTVLTCSAPPERVEGQKSGRGIAISKMTGWKQVEADALPAMLLAQAEDGFAVRRHPEDKGILFHHRRELADGELLFLVNTSTDSPSAGSVESNGGGIERWDPEAGTIEGYPFEATERGVRANYHLPPSGSLLLFLSKEKRTPVPAHQVEISRIPPSGPPVIRRTAPNVLVLDYLDVTAGGKTASDVYFYQASQFAFQQNGMDRNPWDNAVQFRDELVTKKFPPQSGFQATYRFTIGKRVPATLFAVVERPDLYTIECNGKPVQAVPGAWWLDKAFGKIDITQAAAAGENRLVLKASPFTIFHEIEAAYILGDFALLPAARGFTIVPASDLRLGAWNLQGYPFYAQGMAYVQKFRLDSPSGQYRVLLPKWYGSVAKVAVNGKEAGFITSPPWQREITNLVQAGENTIEIVAVGTLKNTLGPHHGNPALGTAWPAMFQKGPSPGPPPGEQYATVGYGLFEPFQLLQLSP